MIARRAEGVQFSQKTLFLTVALILRVPSVPSFVRAHLSFRHDKHRVRTDQHVHEITGPHPVSTGQVA
jgi:hypothetical protein